MFNLVQWAMAELAEVARSAMSPALCISFGRLSFSQLVKWVESEQHLLTTYLGIGEISTVLHPLVIAATPLAQLATLTICSKTVLGAVCSSPKRWYLESERF